MKFILVLLLVTASTVASANAPILISGADLVQELLDIAKNEKSEKKKSPHRNGPQLGFELTHGKPRACSVWLFSSGEDLKVQIIRTVGNLMLAEIEILAASSFEKVRSLYTLEKHSVREFEGWPGWQGNHKYWAYTGDEWYRYFSDTGQGYLEIRNVTGGIAIYSESGHLMAECED